MAQPPPQLERAIDDILAQARAEILRFYANQDVGRVEIDVGPDQIVIKSTSFRRLEPVVLHSKAGVQSSR